MTLSSAVPLLGTEVRKVTCVGTTRYKAVTIIVGVSGCVIVCLVPYKGHINVFYELNGYLGFILVFFMIADDMRTKMAKKINSSGDFD